MRIYRTTTSYDETYEELRLDKKGEELESIEREAYSVHLSVDEYKNSEHVIRHIIEAAIKEGVDVYTGYDRLAKFKICGDELITSTDAIIMFTTIIDDNESSDGDIIDSNKSKVLEKTVITLAKSVKKDE